MNTSFQVILPFLRPIEGLIKDPTVSEIMVNPDSRIFVEREGEVTEVPGVTISEKNLQVAVRNIARALGDEISEEKPLLDSRLPDGSRVAAAIPPCSVGGTTLTIRKFESRYFTWRSQSRSGFSFIWSGAGTAGSSSRSSGSRDTTTGPDSTGSRRASKHAGRGRVPGSEERLRVDEWVQWRLCAEIPATPALQQTQSGVLRRAHGRASCQIPT